MNEKCLVGISVVAAILCSGWSFAAEKQLIREARSVVPVSSLVKEPNAQAENLSALSLPFYLWSRQSFETKKTQELTTLLESVLGPGRAGVYLDFEWPALEASQPVSFEPARINALVVVEKGANVKDIRFVEEITSKVLGMVPERGDKVNIYAVERKATLSQIFFSPEAVLSLIKVFALISLGLILIMVVGRGASTLNVSLERLMTSSRGQDVNVTLSPAARGSLSAFGAQGPRLVSGPPLGVALSGGLAFSSADPELLARVLEEEDSRSIAIFISALDSDMAGKVLSDLSSSKQEEVALALGQMVEPDPREVAQLQAQIHLKLRKFALDKK